MKFCKDCKWAEKKSLLFRITAFFFEDWPYPYLRCMHTNAKKLGEVHPVTGKRELDQQIFATAFRDSWTANPEWCGAGGRFWEACK